MMSGKEKNNSAFSIHNSELIIPEIRFKGFNGAWNERKMLDCSSKIGDGLHGTPKYTDNTGVYFINGNNLVSGSISVSNETKQVSKEEQSKNDNLLGLNTLLLSINGTIGNLAWYRGEKVMLGKSVAFIKLENCDNGYIYSYLQTERIKSYFLNSLTGSTIKNLGLKIIREAPIFIPEEQIEQTQIGNYFQKLDNLINQHQQKHDKLSSIKKAMLEKMFPKQGETVPEIRFKGFEGGWEEKELSSLTDYANGKGHEDKQKTSGKYELINLNSISIGGGLKSSGKFIDETNSTLEENDLVMVLSDVGHGDLLGRVALIPKSNTYVLNQRVALLRPNGAACPQFLLYNINAHQPYFKKQGAGMSQLNISRGSVESFSSCIPKKDEQIKIGNYFQKLDTLIDQHQQQITKLNNIKQACLSKMFV